MLLWPAGIAVGQFTPRVIKPAATCATCRIELRGPIRLGSPDDSVEVAPSGRLVTLGDGGYVVGPGVRGYELIHYDARGRFSGLLGRMGSGPGEFRGIGPVVVGANGSIYAFEGNSQRRFTVFSPELKLLRSGNLPGQTDMAFVMNDGQILTWGSTGPQGDPVRLLDPDGTEVGVFLGPFPQGPGLNGAYWSMSASSYDLQEVARTGTIKQTLHIDSEDFALPKPGEPVGRADRVRPRLSIQGMWQDRDGLLWIVYRVAAANWKPSAASPAPGGERTTLMPEQRHQYYDTVIDVIDPVKGAVLATKRLPGAYGADKSGRAVFRIREDANGLFVEVTRLAFAR